MLSTYVKQVLAEIIFFRTNDTLIFETQSQTNYLDINIDTCETSIFGNTYQI